jgi:hypothetical protein
MIDLPTTSVVTEMIDHLSIRIPPTIREFTMMGEPCNTVTHHRDGLSTLSPTDLAVPV